jgi:argonaute-like protein implicated in RNA metabolism and viral defense
MAFAQVEEGWWKWRRRLVWPCKNNSVHEQVYRCGALLQFEPDTLGWALTVLSATRYMRKSIEDNILFSRIDGLLPRSALRIAKMLLKQVTKQAK